MNHRTTKGLGTLAFLSLTSLACGSSVILDADGDGIPDDEDAEVIPPTGSGAAGPGVEPACAPGSSLREIAPWEQASSFIVLHDGWVYWTTDTAVERAPRDGGGPVEIVTTPSAPPIGLAVDGSGVYVAVDGALLHVDHASGATTALAGGVGLGGAFSVVRVEGEHVYFRQDCEHLARVPTGGGAVETIAVTEGCFGGFALDDEHLFAVDQVDGSLRRVDKHGGASTLLAVGGMAQAGGYSGTAPGITVDDGHVYWVSAAGGFVGSVGKDGEGMTVVIEGLEAVQDVAVTDGLVYWSEQGRVGRASATGQNALTLIDEPIGIVPMGLAVDEERLFFTNYVTNGPVLSVCR